MTDRKTRVSQLATELVRSGNQDTLNVRELVGLLLEETKDSLVTTTGDDTLRMQGQAQVLIRFKRLISKTPMPITTERSTK